MQLPEKLVHQVKGEVASFGGHKFSPNRRVTLVVSVMGKHMPVDFSDELQYSI